LTGWMLLKIEVETQRDRDKMGKWKYDFSGLGQKSAGQTDAKKKRGLRRKKSRLGNETNLRD